jgi:hypothetical protein
MLAIPVPCKAYIPFPGLEIFWSSGTSNMYVGDKRFATEKCIFSHKATIVFALHDFHQCTQVFAALFWLMEQDIVTDPATSQRNRREGGKLRQFPIFVSLDAVHQIPTFTIPLHFGWISCFAHVAAK